LGEAEIVQSFIRWVTPVIDSATSRAKPAAIGAGSRFHAGATASRMKRKYREVLFGPSYKKAMAGVLGANCGVETTHENEWFTPQEYIELARVVLGEIDGIVDVLESWECAGEK
jgi:hypothetical protein